LLGMILPPFQKNKPAGAGQPAMYGIFS